MKLHLSHVTQLKSGIHWLHVYTNKNVNIYSSGHDAFLE